MKRLSKIVTVGAAAILLLSLAPPVEAGNARGRAGPSAGRAKAGRTVTATRPSGGSARVRASGSATYAYGSRHGHGGGYYGGHRHHGYYGHYGHGYYGWGWPWYGYFGHYGYYGYPTAYTLAVNPSELPAAIETDVRPKRAEVWLDGEPIGQARDFNSSWELLYVEPGEHTLEFRREDHVTLALTMYLRGGHRYRIAEELAEGEGRVDRSVGTPEDRQAAATPRRAPERRVAPAPERRLTDLSLARGLLRISARPADAAIYLDGEFLADAGELARLHGALPVAAGTHVIEVARPGFRSQRHEVEVREGQPARLEVELERE